jgi:cysteine desulfurase
MTAERTYLDHNASAPLKPEARAAMLRALELVGNPSSVHAEGRRARALVENARDRIAALVNAQPSEIVFTSGGTEANNWALAAGWDTIFLSGIEHDSVRVPGGLSGARVIEVRASREGVAAVETIAARVLRSSEDLGRGLIALQMANNETGVVQPVAETAAFAREHGLAIHTDAVQGAGRIRIDFHALGVDTLSLSSHKIGGPKGIGALVVRDGISLLPLISGGGQERRRRAGTENVAAIAGFGAAAEAAARNLAQMARVRSLRDRLESGVLARTPDAVVVGREADRLANTSCLARPGRLAETLVIKLDLAGIAVSAGAACSSGRVAQSHVLVAMGLEPEIARGAIRVSLGPETTEDDIAAFLAAWAGLEGSAAVAA